MNLNAVPLREATHSLHDNPSDLIRIRVRSWPPVLEVPLPSGSTLTRNADGGTSVGNGPVELVHTRCLVLTGHTVRVALTIDSNVLHVALLKFMHGRFNGFHTAVFAHALCRDVGMEASPVPVAGNGLGLECDHHTEFLGYPMQEETSHPELIAHCDED